MRQIIYWSLLGIFYIITFTTAWNHYAISPKYYGKGKNSMTTTLNNSTRYCFHFTWMGGNFNNRTFKNIMNKTCNQYFRDKKTLCINPMVATFSGGEPDLKYIIKNHPNAATCRLLQQQVCAKYTFYHNGVVSYATRYCTQININSEGPMQTGCIQEKRGTDVVEVCACASEPGPDGICNAGCTLTLTFPYFFFHVLIMTWYLAS